MEPVAEKKAETDMVVDLPKLVFWNVKDLFERYVFFHRFLFAVTFLALFYANNFLKVFDQNLQLTDKRATFSRFYFGLWY